MLQLLFISHDSTTVNEHEQMKTEAAKWNSSITQFVLFT